MKSSQLSSSLKRRVLPGLVLLLVCVLIAVSKGAPDAAKPSRKHGSSERRMKSHNFTNRGFTDAASDAQPAPLPPNASQGSSADPPSTLTSSPSSSSSSAANASQKKQQHRLIHGSKNAVTITKKEYLKKDWCKTEPFQQVVEEEGCNQKRITNRFCYGQCNSFFIPKTDKEDEVASSFRSCAYCTPKVAEWVTIVLRCPSRTPPFKRKRVQIVKQCKCMAVKLD